MAGGAPLGNQNGAKSRLFEQTLKRAITQDDGNRIRKAAESLLDNAAEGHPWALNMLADRLDGKAAQAVILSQDDENPLFDTLKTSEQLRAKMRGILPAVIGHRTEENQPEYIDTKSPQSQQIDQVDPE